MTQLTSLAYAGTDSEKVCTSVDITKFWYK